MRRAAALASLLLLFGCRPGGHAVRIGSKNFSEQVLLAEIAAQALEARGVAVDRRLNLGGTFVCHKALLAGELDLYPEYTGTAFTAILGEKPVSDPAAVRQSVAEAYRKRWDLVWSPPLGFENNFALIVRQQDAARWNLRRISDLVGSREGDPSRVRLRVRRARRTAFRGSRAPTASPFPCARSRWISACCTRRSRAARST